MLTCWCKSNDAEKTKSIEVAQANIEALEASLSAAAAKVQELKAKRKATMDELYADQKALDQAEAIRMEENKAFHGEETDLLEAISACKGAIVALSKHHADLAQVQSVARQLRKAKVEELALAPMMSTHTGPTLAKARAEALKNFLDAATGTPRPSGAFMAIPGMQSYAPQSGQIFGILKQMRADFESSLTESQKAEAKAAKEFADLKAAKLDEIAAAKKMVEDIDVQVADLGEKAAQETKELEATKEQLGNDQQFLADLKEKCSMSDKEFDARMAARLEEIAAVQDTIKILNSDEAFGVFEKTTKGYQPDQEFVEASASVSFIQASQQTADRRARAAELLRDTKLPTLVLLAASVQKAGAFDKVIAEIERLVAELGQQQKDEVKHRDWCVDEFASNDREMQENDHKKENLVQKRADLEQTIKELTEKIKTVKEEAATVQTEMKKASELREAENADFQEVVQDQRLTQMILQKALTRMREVYALMQEEPGAAHIATSGNKTNAGNGPARFTKYGQNAGGGRVVMMLEKVAADCKKLEDEAVAGEMSAQNVYEDFMKQSNKELTAYGESLQSMMAAKATAEGDLSMAKSDLKDTMKVLEGLHDYKGDLQKSCDFILKNFDARQEARSQEMEALGEAKAILSGMN
jgi:DNA repair exonuclease SbcCD ATPase subunit